MCWFLDQHRAGFPWSCSVPWSEAGLSLGKGCRERLFLPFPAQQLCHGGALRPRALKEGMVHPQWVPQRARQDLGLGSALLQLCQNRSLTWFKPGGAAGCKYLMAPQLPWVNLLQLSPAKLFLKFTGDLWSSPFSWRLLSWVCAEPPSAGRAGFWSCPSSGKGGRDFIPVVSMLSLTLGLLLLRAGRTPQCLT